MLDSCDDAARELESAFGAEGGAVVCDLTTVDEGRGVDGLARVAARLGDVAVCFGASLPAADVARAARTRCESRSSASSSWASTSRPTWRVILPLARRPRPRGFVGPLRPALDGARPDIATATDALILRAAAAASRQGAPVVVVLPGYEGAQLRKCARAVIELADAPAWVFRVARLDDRHGPGDLGDLLDLAPNVLVVADGWYRPCDRGPRPPSKYLLSHYIEARDRVVVAAGVRYRTQLRRYGGAGYGAGLIAVRDAGCRRINRRRRAASPGTARPSGPPTSSSCNAALRPSFEVRRGPRTASTTLCIAAAAASTRTGTRASTRRGHGPTAWLGGVRFGSSRAFGTGADPARVRGSLRRVRSFGCAQLRAAPRHPSAHHHRRTARHQATHPAKPPGASTEHSMWKLLLLATASAVELKQR